MDNRESETGRTRGAALRVLGMVLVLVFAVEMGIMLTMPMWSPWPLGDVALSAVDALLLTCVLSPAMWFFIVRPVRDLSVQRGRLLAKVIEAQEAERTRISRDLHDDLGQLLTAIKIGMRTIEEAPSHEEARSRARRVGAAAGEALEVVRRMARGLQTGALDDLGLRAALERLIEDVAASGALRVEARLGVETGERFAPALEKGVYRLVQEAITNVVKHAGAANMWVELCRRGGSLTLSIRDDGCGFAVRDAEARRATLGLQGMRERVRMLGGAIRFESAPGRGTSILISLPAGEARSIDGGALGGLGGGREQEAKRHGAHPRDDR